MLQGKTIILGVTGSIAAYKTACLAGALNKQHADVHVIMTENATRFISPLTFETLTGNRCPVGIFDRDVKDGVTHIALAKAADLIMVAPASADFIAKTAGGIADDMLTTVILAANCSKYIVPAMNSNMLLNPVTQDNIDKLKHYGFKIIEPESGRLACGDIGVGKMPDPDVLVKYIDREKAMYKDMEGLKVLVTAGPTREEIDPVRFITNHSSGKMGYALAQVCMLRGADVCLVSGPSSVAPPDFVKRIPVVSAAEMYEAVTAEAKDADLIFMAAAVSDYTPKNRAENKIKKTGSDISLGLERTKDILGEISHNRGKGAGTGRQIICGFSMETENLLKNSKEKFERKALDMIAANSIASGDSGFETDTNTVTLITPAKELELGKLSKFETAKRISSEALLMLEGESIK